MNTLLDNYTNCCCELVVTKRQHAMNSSSARNAVILTITISMIIAGVYGAGENLLASAKKPQAVIEWSNGFPSGEHGTINIHGKKLDPFFNCDNSDAAKPFGSSIFVPITTTEDEPAEINFVSNKRASGFNILQVLDPCTDPFGNTGPLDPALIQLEAKEMQVYWRILGKPNNGNSASEAMLTNPTLIDQCNFLPAFADDSEVDVFDIDVGLAIIDFNVDEKYVDNNMDTVFDAGDSIYRDEGDGVVGPGDTLLYAGTGAAPGDMLESFSVNEKHEDTTGGAAGVGEFDSDETVYFDVDDADDFVAAGDTRLANAITQGLPEDEGGNALDCTDEALVGLGLITNKGAVFKKDGETLKRFEEPEPTKGKGKSKAVEITDLFIWSGVVCHPSLDLNDDGELDINDVPLVDVPLTEAKILAAITTERADMLWPAGAADFDGVISDEELQAYFGTLEGCEEFLEEWVFIIADIVLYGLDYVNNGATLTQMRFYPVATLTE